MRSSLWMMIRSRGGDSIECALSRERAIGAGSKRDICQGADHGQLRLKCRSRVVRGPSSFLVRMTHFYSLD
jgi:hypothetical protein